MRFDIWDYWKFWNRTKKDLPIIRDISEISLSLRFKRLRDSNLYKASGTRGNELHDKSTSRKKEQQGKIKKESNVKNIIQYPNT